MIKLIALLKRKRDLPVEAFQRHWLEVHGPLIARTPGLKRYVQSHALLQGYGKGELVFDGIDERWFESPQRLHEFHGSPEAAAADEDEAAFLDRSRTVLMRVDVFVIKDGPVLADAVKNIEFVNRRPGMALASFQQYWRETHGPIASRIPSIRRYEQNHVVAEAYAGGAAPRYDGSPSRGSTRPPRCGEARRRRNMRRPAPTNRTFCRTATCRSSSRASTSCSPDRREAAEARIVGTSSYERPHVPAKACPRPRSGWARFADQGHAET